LIASPCGDHRDAAGGHEWTVMNATTDQRGVRRKGRGFIDDPRRFFRSSAARLRAAMTAFSTVGADSKASQIFRRTSK
jgi:hypothetical protein